MMGVKASIPYMPRLVIVKVAPCNCSAAIFPAALRRIDEGGADRGLRLPTARAGRHDGSPARSKPRSVSTASADMLMSLCWTKVVAVYGGVKRRMFSQRKAVATSLTSRSVYKMARARRPRQLLRLRRMLHGVRWHRLRVVKCDRRGRAGALEHAVARQLPDS